MAEHLFRHESGKMMATLTRIFGAEHLTLAEDVVQAALVRALQTRPFYGVPQNPAAWIMRASRNLAIAEVHGPRAAIEAIGGIRNQQSLESCCRLYEVLAEFESQLNNHEGAATHLRSKLVLAKLKSEQSLLSRRLKDCEQRR